MAAFDYSVWALPPEDVRTRAKKLMETLGSEFGGPEFEPHVTVVGAISLTPEDALQKFRSAFKGLKNYTAHGRGISTTILLLDPTPDVIKVSDHCSEHFGYVRPTPYKPHMSLLYGDLTDEEKKKAQDRANALDEGFGSVSFPLTRLVLYKTDTEDKTLKSWEKVAECDLEAV